MAQYLVSRQILVQYSEHLVPRQLSFSLWWRRIFTICQGATTRHSRSYVEEKQRRQIVKKQANIGKNLIDEVLVTKRESTPKRVLAMGVGQILKQVFGKIAECCFTSIRHLAILRAIHIGVFMAIAIGGLPLAAANATHRATEKDLAPQKPDPESILKPKSFSKMVDDLEVVTNAKWQEDDFIFVNAVEVRAPLKFARTRMLEFSLYPQMSSAIKDLHYDEAAGLLIISGEAGGLTMNSVMRADLQYWDRARYEIIRGDLEGFIVTVYLWERQGKTITVASGLLPQGRKRFPGLVGFAFPTLAEFVLGVATKNFRKFIEAAYNQKR